MNAILSILSLANAFDLCLLSKINARGVKLIVVQPGTDTFAKLAIQCWHRILQSILHDTRESLVDTERGICTMYGVTI